MTTFTAFIEFDEQTRLYVGIVPGAHTQASSLDELRVNLQEVLELCLEEQGECASGRRGSSACSRLRSPEWRARPRSIRV